LSKSDIEWQIEAQLKLLVVPLWDKLMLLFSGEKEKGKKEEVMVLCFVSSIDT
jgi:hypothetical protein